MELSYFNIPIFITCELCLLTIIFKNKDVQVALSYVAFIFHFSFTSIGDTILPWAELLLPEKHEKDGLAFQCASAAMETRRVSQKVQVLQQAPEGPGTWEEVKLV